MNPKDLTIAEKRKALELYDLIFDGNVKYSHTLTDEQVEEIFMEMENMTNQMPPHRNAVEPFQDLARRVERLEREAKGFRRFCGSLLFLCVAGFIVSTIFKLVNG
jgi:hypothetical protein